METASTCPRCGEPVDPDDPETVRCESTTVAGFVGDQMRRITPDRDFHLGCFDAQRGIGWKRKT